MTARKSFTLPFHTLSPGQGYGKAFLYRDILTRDISFFNISKQDVTTELKRITGSFRSVKKELSSLEKTVSRELSRSDGMVFKAQRLFLEDDSFWHEFEKEIKSKLINAEQVTKNVFGEYINRFRDSPDATIRAKTEDLRDVLRRVLRNLMQIETNVLEKLPPQSILVTRRLLPSDTVRLDNFHVIGIVVQEGSQHSHSAILARALSIPAICLKDGASIRQIPSGARLLIDTADTALIVHPSAAQARRFSHQSIAAKKNEKKIRVRTRAARTVSGKKIKVFANANNGPEIDEALRNGADGIGLLRLESLYLQRKNLPDASALYSELNRILAHAGHRQVTVRLLDVGGDKHLPYLDRGDEISPFLGMRGVRILLRNPDLLDTQLEALLRLCPDFPIMNISFSLYRQSICPLL